MYREDEPLIEPWSLGQLINALKRCKPEANLQFDFVYMRPGKALRNWRGWGGRLALSYTSEDTLPVWKYLALLQEVVGQRLEGYKGGSDVITADARLQVANFGETSDTVVSGLVDHDHYVVIRTAHLDD